MNEPSKEMPQKIAKMMLKLRSWLKTSFFVPFLASFNTRCSLSNIVKGYQSSADHLIKWLSCHAVAQVFVCLCMCSLICLSYGHPAVRCDDYKSPDRCVGHLSDTKPEFVHVQV